MATRFSKFYAELQDIIDIDDDPRESVRNVPPRHYSEVSSESEFVVSVSSLEKGDVTGYEWWTDEKILEAEEEIRKAEDEIIEVDEEIYDLIFYTQDNGELFYLLGSEE